MRHFLLILSAVILLSSADCGNGNSVIEAVYKNTTDYDINIRDAVKIPAKGSFTRYSVDSGGGIGERKRNRDLILDSALPSSSSYSRVVTFSNPKTGKTVCFDGSRISAEKSGKYIGFYDDTRYTWEDLSTSEFHRNYRITYTFTDEDLKWADEETCKEDLKHIEELKKRDANQM